MRPGTPVGLPINPPRMSTPPDDGPAHADDAGLAFAPEQLRPLSPGHRPIFLLQTPEMFLRGPERPAFAAVRFIRKKCRMDDSLPLQAHKKAVIVFLQLVNAGDAASRSVFVANHISVFSSHRFCSASAAPVPRHLIGFGGLRPGSGVSDLGSGISGLASGGPSWNLKSRHHQNFGIIALGVYKIVVERQGLPRWWR